MQDFPLWKKLLIAVVLIGALVLSLPNLFALLGKPVPGWLPQQTVNLGLDLQGGSHLQLQVDVTAYLQEQRENLRNEVRRTLRDAKLGYRNLRIEGETVRLTPRLNKGQTEEAFEEALQEVDRRFTLSQTGEDWVLSLSEQAMQDARKQLLQQSIEIVRRRVDETGTREPIIQQQGEDRIILQVPGMNDPERLKQLLGKTAKLSFHLVVSPGQAGEAGSRVVRMQEGGTIRIERQPLLGGDQLSDAHAAFNENQPIVSFTLTTQGARKFGAITSENVGRPFAILLDEEVISAPVIREPILGGSGMISGNFTAESANDLAILLRAGALPAPLNVLEERTVGPSLGEDSVQAGSRAFVLGVLLVALMMAVYYKRSGVYAVVALACNMLMIVAALSALGATLTLPGIAGIVLTLGMVVDANVLIYERIKEELRSGKKVPGAVEAGFQHAFSTIFDANITTLLAALILFQMGAGPVRGFAVTLSIGILTSMFTAIMLTRLMLVTHVRHKRPQKLSI